jgi:hypothetical protein
VTRAGDVLSSWRAAPEFAKVFILLDWSSEIQGITTEEVAVVLYPDETLPNGAPTTRARKKASHIIKKIRHHPAAEGMVIFAQQRGGGWFNMNVTKQADWKAIRIRFEKTIAGFKDTIKKHDDKMKNSLVLRRQSIDNTTNEFKAALAAEIDASNTNKKRKKKANTNA